MLCFFRVARIDFGHQVHVESRATVRYRSCHRRIVYCSTGNSILSVANLFHEARDTHIFNSPDELFYWHSYRLYGPRTAGIGGHPAGGRDLPHPYTFRDGDWLTPVFSPVALAANYMTEALAHQQLYRQSSSSLWRAYAKGGDDARILWHALLCDRTPMIKRSPPSWPPPPQSVADLVLPDPATVRVRLSAKQKRRAGQLASQRRIMANKKRKQPQQQHTPLVDSAVVITDTSVLDSGGDTHDTDAHTDPLPMVAVSRLSLFDSPVTGGVGDANGDADAAAAFADPVMHPSPAKRVRLVLGTHSQGTPDPVVRVTRTVTRNDTCELTCAVLNDFDSVYHPNDPWTRSSTTTITTSSSALTEECLNECDDMMMWWSMLQGDQCQELAII